MRRKRSIGGPARIAGRTRMRSIGPEPLTGDHSVSIREVLPGIFKKLEADRLPWLDRLNEEWDALTKDLVSGHAHPAELRDRTLLIHVDSSVWLNELVRYKRSALLARLQERFGSDRIEKVFLRLDPGRGTSPANGQ